MWRAPLVAGGLTAPATPKSPQRLCPLFDYIDTATIAHAPRVGGVAYLCPFAPFGGGALYAPTKAHRAPLWALCVPRVVGGC